METGQRHYWLHFTGESKYMANRINPNRTQTDFKLHLSPEQRAILELIGGGNMTQGLKVAIDQAGHFYNCCLDPDMNLNFVGLVTTLANQDDDWPQKGFPKGLKRLLRGFSLAGRWWLTPRAYKGLKVGKEKPPEGGLMWVDANLFQPAIIFVFFF